jgi:hypothetical protein
MDVYNLIGLCKLLKLRRAFANEFLENIEIHAAEDEGACKLLMETNMHTILEGIFQVHSLLPSSKNAIESPRELQ